MASFKQLQKRSAALKQKLADFSELAPDLVENVIQYARSLVKPGTDEIDETVFMSQMMQHFEITDHFVLDMMIDDMKKSCQNRMLSSNDKKKPNGIPLLDYCRLMCTMLSNNLDKKVNLVFRVYDNNGDGVLSRLEMYLWLKPCIQHTEDTDVEEATRDLIETVMGVVDYNKNGFIELEEFRRLVKSNILYIDLLGQVVPGNKVINRFIQKIQGKSPTEVAKMIQEERAQSLLEPTLPSPPSLYPIVLELP